MRLSPNCDASEIVVPEVEEGHFVRTGDLPTTYDVNHRYLLHGDPRCPYIAAHLIAHKPESYEFREQWVSIEITELYNGLVCELPDCQAKIGLPLVVEDRYLTKQHFNDGFTPPPPRPRPTIGDGDTESEDFRDAHFDTVMKVYGRRVRTEWAKEADILHCVRIVQKMLKHPWIKGRPKTDTEPAIEGVHWSRVRTILEALGWQEVANRVNFEIDVKISHRLSCPRCFLRHYKERQHDLKYEFRAKDAVRQGPNTHCPNCGCELTWDSNLPTLEQ